MPERLLPNTKSLRLFSVPITNHNDNHDITFKFPDLNIEFRLSEGRVVKDNIFSLTGSLFSLSFNIGSLTFYFFTVNESVYL